MAYLGRVVGTKAEKAPTPFNPELEMLAARIPHDFVPKFGKSGSNLEAAYKSISRFADVKPLELYSLPLAEEAEAFMDAFLNPYLQNSCLIDIETTLTPEVSRGSANPGWPWEQIYPTKKAFWSNPTNVQFMRDVWDRDLVHGEWWPFGKVMVKKGELRPVEKLKDNKLRTVIMTDVVHTQLSKCLWWDLMQKVQEAGVEATFLALGFSPWYGGINRLVRHWSPLGGGYEFDVGKMDANLHLWVLMMLTRVCFRFLKPNLQTAANWSRAMLLTLMVAMCPLVMPDGHVFLKGVGDQGGNLSGQYLTTLFNSLYALFLLIYAWLYNRSSTDRDRPVTWHITQFRKFVAAAIAGDDITYTVAPKYEFQLSGRALSNVLFDEFGIELETPSIERRDWMDLRFLALGMRWDEKLHAIVFTIDPDRAYCSALSQNRGQPSDPAALTLQRLVAIYTVGWGDLRLRKFMHELICKYMELYAHRRHERYTPWDYARSQFYPDSVMQYLHTGRGVRLAPLPKSAFSVLDDLQQHSRVRRPRTERRLSPLNLLILFCCVLVFALEPFHHVQQALGFLAPYVPDSIREYIKDQQFNHGTFNSLFHENPNYHLEMPDIKKKERKRSPKFQAIKDKAQAARVTTAINKAVRAAAMAGPSGGPGWAGNRPQRALAPSGAKQIAKQIMTKSGVRQMTGSRVPKARWNLRGMAKKNGGYQGLIRVAGVDLIDGIKWSQIGNTQSTGTAITIQGKSTFTINPYTVGVNRLATFAGFYEKYEFKKVLIEWVPSAGTDISGYMVGAWDLDVGDTLSSNISSAYKTVISQPGMKSAKFYQRASWSMPYKATRGGGKDGFYTQSANATDAHFINQSAFHLLIGAPAQNLAAAYPSTGDAGQLFLHYVCDFWAPEDSAITQAADFYNGLTNVAPTTSNNWGTAMTQDSPGGDNQVSFTYDASQNVNINLPAGYSGWLVMGSITAAVSVSISLSPFVTSTNLALMFGTTGGNNWYNNSQSTSVTTVEWHSDNSNIASFWSAFTTVATDSASTVQLRHNGLTLGSGTKGLLIVDLCPANLPQGTCSFTLTHAETC